MVGNSFILVEGLSIIVVFIDSNISLKCSTPLANVMGSLLPTRILASLSSFCWLVAPTRQTVRLKHCISSMGFAARVISATRARNFTRKIKHVKAIRESFDKKRAKRFLNCTHACIIFLKFDEVPI